MDVCFDILLSVVKLIKQSSNSIEGFRIDIHALVVLHLNGLLNPLTPGAFCKKCVFWTVWWVLGWISAKLALIWPKMHLQLGSLHHVLRHFDSGMHL